MIARIGRAARRIDSLTVRTALTRAAPALVVIAVVTIFYWHALTSGDSTIAIPTDSDVLNSFRPRTIDQFLSVHHYGFLPQWSDRIGLGQLSVGQNGSEYLPRLVALALAGSAAQAADWLVWVHTLAAGLGALALARFYGIARWAATLAGVMFALSHLAVRWAPLSPTSVHFATLPFALLGVELIWRRRALVGVPLLGLALGFNGLGSHLQFTHLLVQAVGVLVAFRLFADAAPWRRRVPPALWSLAGLALGVVIAAPALIPFVLEQADSIRQHTAAAYVKGIHSSGIGSFLSPTAARAPEEIGDDFYIGLFAPLALVGFAIALRSRKLAILPLLIALSLAVGLKTFVLRLLVLEVPGWQVTSNVQRVSLIVTLPLALLVGLGAARLLSLRPARAAAALAALLAGSAAIWHLAMDRVHAGSTPITAAALIIAAVALLVVWELPERVHRWVVVSIPVVLLTLTLAAALHERALGWRPVPAQAPSGVQTWLRLVASNNDPNRRWMSYCQSFSDFLYRPVKFLESPGRWLDTYESFVDTDYYRYWQRLTGSQLYANQRGALGTWNQHRPQDPAPNAALVNAAGIGQVLGTTACKRRVDRFGWAPVSSAPAVGATRRAGAAPVSYVVYHNSAAFPLAYVSGRARTVAGPAEAVARLARSSPAFAAHTDYVEGTQPVPSTDRPPQEMKLKRDNPQHLSVTVTPQPRPSLLVLVEHFNSGWHAYAQGPKGAPRQLHIRRANGVFQAVVIPAWTRKVVFKFNPLWQRLSLPLAYLAALAAALTLLGAWVSKRTRADSIS
ncbi:MAG TPA: hypothetical protein VHE14_05550 [Solirubrobacteraceae bacterium]|nr:hypothetical protein [Solirubrobacteraceae bacterium]